MPAPLAFHVLGPLEVTQSGTPVPLGGPRERVLLAALLVEHGRVRLLERMPRVRQARGRAERCSGQGTRYDAGAKPAGRFAAGGGEQLVDDEFDDGQHRQYPDRPNRAHKGERRSGEDKSLAEQPEDAEPGPSCQPWVLSVAFAHHQGSTVRLQPLNMFRGSGPQLGR